MKKIYPDSGVELNPFISKNYDSIMNVASMGLYRRFINGAIADMNIQPNDNILDLGCGTGRNALIISRYLKENGRVIGIDISDEMQRQFRQKFSNDSRGKFLKKRIDQPFDLQERFDKVFISFVIHGFPHEIRAVVIENAFIHLKPRGAFYILDFSEFDMDAMPFIHRAVFKTIECQYAFDYIKHDWKGILKEARFSAFEEHFYMKEYVRLLKAGKNDCI
jgi:demethylmenaquinone methyltransferase/2-methoxy-6-polyprenyl-1,4-benzoquinol methylase